MIPSKKDKNKLQQFQTQTNGELMAAAFEVFFKREYPDRAIKIQQCSVVNIYDKPGRSCRLTYQLTGKACGDEPFKQWVNTRTNAQKHKDLSVKMPRERLGYSFWKPVSYWPEMNMILYMFPYDPKLPYLGQLLDSEFIKGQIHDNLTGLGLTSGWECKKVVIDKIKYRPGKNCVLRYDVVMTDSKNNVRKIEFYGKTYNNSKSRYVYDVLRNICSTTACTQGQLHIPTPIAHIDSANTFWQFAWQGDKLINLGRKDGWRNILQSDMITNIAAMLALLHQTEVTGGLLRTGNSVDIIAKHAKEDLADILPYLPERKNELENIADIIVDLRTTLRSSIPSATLHGTFKIAQILCCDKKVAMIDFDFVCNGDPLYDVAEFIASLVSLKVVNRNLVDPITKSTDDFIFAYQKQVPWKCDHRRLSFYVVVFLLGKIHASLKKKRSEHITNIQIYFDLVYDWLEHAS